MRKTKRALKWSAEAAKAFDEYTRRTLPSWRRHLAAVNTPEAAQADFEEEAIESAAYALYRDRMRRIGVDTDD